jgi:hypothetical protein
MDDDLNVANLLETRAERAPTTQNFAARLTRRRRKEKQFTPLTGLALTAVVVALAIVIISGRSGRLVHVMERY